jgi:glycosidase
MSTLTPAPANEPRTVGPWWQSAVIYQVYPRSFQDSDGDGIGDLAGVTARLAYLAELGVDAVWLSPFYPSPMADFGYDVADYCDVDPLFGTLADFDTLVATAHGLGLRVIVDLVPNHTSNEHAWFKESRSSRTNPKRDWYIWRDGKANGERPNNWLAHFGGPMWTFDEATGQWYLHSFLPEQPDLNWRNPEVRAAMMDVVRFWLAHGVDGFRIDVAHSIMKDPDLRDNPPNPGAGRAHKALGDFDSLLHVHDANHPDVHDVYQEMRAVVDAWPGGRNPVLIGEIHIFNLDEWARFFGDGGNEMQLPFNFGLLKTPWDGTAIARHVEAVEAAAARRQGWPTYVLGNHDEHRVATRVGRTQAATAMALLLTLRGTPTVYYGDELGHPDVDVSPEQERDPWGLRVPGLGLSRDPARTPMPWDGGPNAGFTSGDGEPWLPMVPEAGSLSVAAQQDDDGSMLQFTRRLLALRRSTPALTAGEYRTVRAEPGLLAYERALDGHAVVVVLELGGEARTVSLGEGAARVLLSSAGSRDETIDLVAVAVGAGEALVLEVP